MAGTVLDLLAERGPVDRDPVPVGRDDGLNRVARGAQRLLQAVLAADPELDGFYAGQSVVGLIAQEYEGRAIKELIQNAHDQLDENGRIHLLLHDDDLGQPVLYVANDGRPFADENSTPSYEPPHPARLQVRQSATRASGSRRF